MWIIFFAISTSSAVYFTYKNIFDYLEFDVTTRFDVINEDESEFPTVSFCSQQNLDGNLESIIMDCLYNSNSDCRTNKSLYFESFTDEMYGNCFRFNSGLSNKLLKSTLAGNAYGLFITFNFQTNNLLKNKSSGNTIEHP